jgi:hypothetical protein
MQKVSSNNFGGARARLTRVARRGSFGRTECRRSKQPDHATDNSTSPNTCAPTGRAHTQQRRPRIRYAVHPNAARLQFFNTMKTAAPRMPRKRTELTYSAFLSGSCCLYPTRNKKRAINDFRAFTSHSSMRVKSCAQIVAAFRKKGEGVWGWGFRTVPDGLYTFGPTKPYFRCTANLFAIGLLKPVGCICKLVYLYSSTFLTSHFSSGFAHSLISNGLRIKHEPLWHLKARKTRKGWGEGYFTQDFADASRVNVHINRLGRRRLASPSNVLLPTQFCRFATLSGLNQKSQYT